MLKDLSGYVKDLPGSIKANKKEVTDEITKLNANIKNTKDELTSLEAISSNLQKDLDGIDVRIPKLKKDKASKIKDKKDLEAKIEKQNGCFDDLETKRAEGRLHLGRRINTWVLCGVILNWSKFQFLTSDLIASAFLMAIYHEYADILMNVWMNS